MRATGQERVAAVAAVLGGILVAGGAFLPWLSFYAGLYPMRGVVGPWGRLLVVGGLLSALLGVYSAWRPGRRVALGSSMLAGGLTLFAGWLVFQLLLSFQRLQGSPMLVPRMGPGLFVVLAGALVALAPAVPRLRR